MMINLGVNINNDYYSHTIIIFLFISCFVFIQKGIKAYSIMLYLLSIDALIRFYEKKQRIVL